MKKILLFCSLTVLLLSLAVSAQAAVNVNVTFPADGKLNYQTTKPITWTYSGAVIAPRFNISIVQTVGSVETIRPIVTQALCKAPTATDPCTFSWKVGSLNSGRFLMGVDYKIRVCVAGVSDCGDSATAFKIIPPALTTQWQVLNLFKTAMGNRYNDLNSNAKSGAQGVYDCIITEYPVTPATVPPSTASKITKTMVNTEFVGSKKIYELTDPADILVWFKDKFKAVIASDPNGVILSIRDQQGIQYAMNNRFDDLCSSNWITTMNGLTQTYKTKVITGTNAVGTPVSANYVPAVGTPGQPGYVLAVGHPASTNYAQAVPSLQKVRDNTIKNCNDDYNKKVACVKGVPCKDKKGVNIKYSNGNDVPTTDGMTAKNSQYNNSTVRYIEQEQYANQKDLCIADAYKKFNNDKTTEWGHLSTTAADDTRRTCLGDKKTW